MSTSPLFDSGAPHDAATETDARLYNPDLAPVPHDKRTWTGYSIFAMWMSDVHSVGGYTFAASLFLLGISGWQVLIALTVGILVVYVLMNWVGKPSYVHGIPFPVMARVSMGVMGANLAAVIRGVVGIVWYGVQTYFASKAGRDSAAAFHSRIGGAGHSQLSAARRPRLGQLPVHVDLPGVHLPARDGNNPQVHRLLRAGRLCSDVCADGVDSVAGRPWKPEPDAGRKGAERWRTVCWNGGTRSCS